MSLPRTSRDLNFPSCITPKSWQKHQFISYANSNSSQRIPPKNILSKKSSQKESSQKIPSKKFLQKNPPKKYPKTSQKNPKTISQKISKILKVSNSLHRTWRPKTLSGLLFTNSSKYVSVASYWHRTLLTSFIYHLNYDIKMQEFHKNLLLVIYCFHDEKSSRRIF